MSAGKIFAVGIIVLLLHGSVCRAADWKHWRGPDLNGSAEEKNLPGEWSKTKNLRWTAAMPGPGSATPIICNSKVFISSTDGNDNQGLLALAFDAKTGKEVWRKKAASDTRIIPRNNMATPSPVTDGKFVFFLYGSGDLVAFDYDGNIVWSRNLEKEYGNITMKFGYSSSPLLYDNRLYIQLLRRDTAYRDPQNDGPLDSFLLGLDAKTGENIFKHQRITDAEDETLDSYTSPMFFKSASRTQIIIMGANFVTSHNPKTGAEFWRYDYNPDKGRRLRNIPSIVPSADMLYGVKSRGKLLFAIKPPHAQTENAAELAWTFDGPAPDSSTPLYYKGNLYVLDGLRSKTVTCLDAKTGKEKWQGKLEGKEPYYASLTAADDKLYCINEAGRMVILAASDDKFNVLSQIELDESPTCASIAIADSRLYVRTAKNLYCIEETAK
jgi:outer membrane protein assembly factor BamB